MSKRSSKSVTKSSTAEYFAKNLQQVGFSSPTKAVLTTLKESLDNSLDACEEYGILPELNVTIEKLGKGSLKNTDRIRIEVEDNGPGIALKDIPRVFGEYLASSKFGRGRCSRGQQGIGISAATTWAVQTTATGAQVITKQKGQRKAISCLIATDLKKNVGIIRNKESVDWEAENGTKVAFEIDGRVQLNGEAGLLNYIRGNILVNPHMTISYKLPDMDAIKSERVSTEIPTIPVATNPHPHTMKLGEFISHARLFGRTKVKDWMRNNFSRVTPKVITEIVSNGKAPKTILDKTVQSLGDGDFKKLFEGIQHTQMMAPPTSSVMSVGEEALALSIKRLGDIDYFSVVSRKPVICDFKPVQVEIALARLTSRSSESEDSVQVLRFANRVPLQFDKASCAVVKAINSVNWRSYGLRQSRNQLPIGPYVIAVSVISPFIKFKNASKETIDSSDELVEEIRRSLMKAGQKLSRHLKREHRADELENKIQHIEKFSPLLVECLVRILEAPNKRREAAHDGLRRILGRDTKEAEKKLTQAEQRLGTILDKQKHQLDIFSATDSLLKAEEKAQNAAEEKAQKEEKQVAEEKPKKTSKAKKTKTKVTTKTAKKKATKKKSAKKKVAKKKIAKKTSAKKKAVKKKATKKKVAKKAAKKKATKKTPAKKKRAKKSTKKKKTAQKKK